MNKKYPIKAKLKMFREILILKTVKYEIMMLFQIQKTLIHFLDVIPAPNMFINAKLNKERKA